MKAERATKTKEPKEPKQPKERKQKTPKVKAERGNAKGRLTGLKIGASQLAAARVSNNGSAELLQVAREPLAPGIVVGGELRDPDALAEALKDFFAKHSLPKKGVRLGIANNRIGVRTFEIAGIDDQKQLANAIRFRAQEALPIPIDEAVLDYQVLGEGVDEDGQPTKRVLLVVAYRELIDRYVDACKKAGITLAGIDLEAFALLRALQAPQDGVGTDASAALVAVAIGHDRSTFAVSDGRVCEFTRVLEWGGSALNVAIARALDAAPSEVEASKRALALTDEMVPGRARPPNRRRRRAKRCAGQSRRSRASSSPRSSTTRTNPARWASARSCSTGGTAHLPGPRRRARAPDRRARSRRRSARAHEGFEEGRRARADRLARRRNRARDRGLSMRAVNLLPRDQAQRTIKKESLPVLVGGCSGLLVARRPRRDVHDGQRQDRAQQRKLDDLNRSSRLCRRPRRARQRRTTAARRRAERARERAEHRAVEPRCLGSRLPRVLARAPRGRLADDAQREVADLAGDEHVEHGRQHRPVDVHDPGPHLLARRRRAAAVAAAGRARPDERAADQLDACRRSGTSRSSSSRSPPTSLSARRSGS